MAVQVNNFSEENIFIISEDSKSFLLYLEIFLVNIKKFRIQNNNSILKNKKGEVKNLKNFIKNIPKNKKTIKLTIFHHKSDPTSIVEFAKEIKNNHKNINRIYCVFDYVFKSEKENHKKYKNTISQKNNLGKINIEIIESIPSYEFWLLTHIKDYSDKSFSNNNEVLREINNTMSLKNNNKKFDYKKNETESLKKEFVIKENIDKAIRTCEKLDKNHKENESKEANPSSKIYELMTYINNLTN